MSSQKFILESKTVQSAILTFAIAILPHVLEGVNDGFTLGFWMSFIPLACSTAWNIFSRYVANTTVYTPPGLPGRDYVPAWKQD